MRTFYIACFFFKDEPPELADWHVFTDAADMNSFVEDMKQQAPIDLIRMWTVSTADEPVSWGRGHKIGEPWVKW